MSGGFYGRKVKFEWDGDEIEGIREKLAEAQEVDERAFRRALARWMDIYADIEEGQRAVLRSAEVTALRPEGVEIED